MKKIIKNIVLSFVLISSLINVNYMQISANDECVFIEPTIIVEEDSSEISPFANPADPVTVNVNKTVTANMSQGGCWGTVKFKITGTYTYANYLGIIRVTSRNLNVQILSVSTDWTVAIDSVQYTNGAGNVDVLIRFHYRQPYYDCAYTGAYTYTAVEATV